MSHVLALSDLPCAASCWREEGAVIVLAAGCFDPMHYGHVQHLETARAQGNVLVVSVAGDDVVRKAKGPNRPRQTAEHRAKQIAALRCVDAVVICEADTVAPVIEQLQPHVFVKGAEYREHSTTPLRIEAATVAKHGGRTVYASGPVINSSTAILAGV